MSRAGLLVVLVLMGAGWGITQPLAKIAVSQGYRQFGLVFWQLVIGVIALWPVMRLRGRRMSLAPRHLKLYALIALIGTVLPNAASYQAAVHLPSGILSILISMVVMFAFPMALLLGIDRFSWLRLAGVLFGLGGVLLLVAPEASLPDPAMLVYLPLGLIAPLFYAFEGNYVARWGTEGLGPIEVLFGASVLGCVIALPLALIFGQFIDPRPPWGAPDLALVASSLVHVVAYTGYVWLVGLAGAVFTAQVSYLVTGFGVMWAMLILNESYSPWFWAAMAMIFLGMFLVQPRRGRGDSNRPLGAA